MNDSKKDRLIWTIVITVGFFMLVGIMSVAYESEHGVNTSDLSQKNNNKSSYNTVQTTITTEPPKHYVPQIGDTVIIEDSDMKVSFAGITDRDFDSFVEYMQAKDQYGCMELMNANRVYTIKNGVKAIFIAASGFGVRKIRVIEGENVGRLGYVFSEAIKQMEK